MCKSHSACRRISAEIWELGSFYHFSFPYSFTLAFWNIGEIDSERGNAREIARWWNHVSTNFVDLFINILLPTTVYHTNNLHRVSWLFQLHVLDQKVLQVCIRYLLVFPLRQRVWPSSAPARVGLDEPALHRFSLSVIDAFYAWFLDQWRCSFYQVELVLIRQLRSLLHHSILWSLFEDVKQRRRLICSHGRCFHILALNLHNCMSRRRFAFA